MKEKYKNVIMVALFSVVILSLSLFSVFSKKDRYSESERRALEKFPEISKETVFSGEFSEKFELYATDNFYKRDLWRKIKNGSALYIFNMEDTNDLYIKDGHISKIEYPENPLKKEETAEKIKDIYEKYLKDKDVKIYLSVIPDKGKFLAGDKLSIDYESFEESFFTKVPFAEYIKISNLLTKDSYYKTDSHWKQEEIIPVAEKILNAMGKELKGSFEKETVKNDFYGVYAGQMGFYGTKDEITLLKSEYTESAVVTSFDSGTPEKAEVYSLKELESADPYEVYLGGATAILTIDNPLVKDKSHLVVFRDSFGSSLIPLLLGSYEKITVVDTRYVNPSLLGNFVEFSYADVLFMYSSTIINQSSMLK